MHYNRKKKKKLTKNKISGVLFLASIVLIISIGFVKIVNTVHISLLNKDTKITQKENYIDKLPKEVTNSNDPVIKKLLSKLENNSDINTILNDVSLYPKELLELASKKPEVVQFVADYPNRDSSTTQVMSMNEKYEKGKIPLFIQWDKRWGYDKYGSNFMAVNGCGPTSLAMVIVGLTGNTEVDPKVVADFSRENGYLIDGIGSSWTLMSEGSKNFGLNSKEVPLCESTILKTLKKGQPIIASMGPGEFTTNGHYIVLTGVDSDNKIIVNDSDSKIRSKKTWDVDVFMKEAKNLWSFTAI